MTQLSYPLPEAADLLGVSRSSMYRLIAAGEIRSYRIGRRRHVSQRELQRFIDAREAGAPETAMAEG